MIRPAPATGARRYKYNSIECAGRDGMLEAVFDMDRTGRTIVTRQFSRVPLHAIRAMYCDEDCPEMAYLYVVSASGGILKGDRYRMSIEMKRGAKAHVTTQGATRVYGTGTHNATRNVVQGAGQGVLRDSAGVVQGATQEISITMEAGSYLEFVPDQIIPYAGSRFRQDTTLVVHDTATMVYSEIITPGRVAMGEAFEYETCHIRTMATNQEGRTRLADAARLEPAKQRLGSLGVLGEKTVVGSVYVLTCKKNMREMYPAISDAIYAGDLYWGASVLRDDGGLLVRILGGRTESVKDAVMDVVRTARQACIGFPLSGIRKG